MKQHRNVVLMAAAFFATGVLAQGMEHPSLGLADPGGAPDGVRLFLAEVDGTAWRSNAPIPQGGGLAQTTTAASGDGTALYVIGGGIGGGLTPTNIVRKYDSLTDSWTTAAPVPQTGGIRAFGSAVSVDGSVYVFGGYDGTSVLNTLHIYNEADNTWSRGANLPGARFGSSVATDGNVIWVIGGFDGGFTESNTVWGYDPSGDAWTTGLAPMPIALGRIHGVALPDGTIHVFAGGFDGVNHRVYDTVGNAWSSAPLMPFGVTDPATVYYPCTGRIYLAGGGGPAPRGQGRTQIFDLALGTWSQGSMMPAPALDNTSGVILGSTFYFEGGFNGLDAATSNYALDL
jgi:hypothetical protein